jgi:hypothetical protein
MRYNTQIAATRRKAFGSYRVLQFKNSFLGIDFVFKLKKKELSLFLKQLKTLQRFPQHYFYV